MSDFRTPTSAERLEIYALLESSGLPIADLSVADPFFIVAADGACVNGVVGFEQFGDVGLLRSLAVRREAQARKLGSSLVVEAERLARSVGIRELVLLTQTAADFFERRGYARIERTNAPSAIAQSSEFRTLCPSTATCMIKSLG